MTDDRFNDLMRDAAQTWRTPPAPDLDGMWTEIEARMADVPTRAEADTPATSVTARPGSSRRRTLPTWLAIAATLVVGLGLGRLSATVGRGGSTTTTATTATAATTVAQTTTGAGAAASNSVANSYEGETSRYLGQTAALLVALPSEVRSGRANRQFVGRAGELLTTTRLLIDSPAANDPQMRNLLEDLELVLAQVVRLQQTNGRTELDLINRALEQRDVLPRLRTAVATNTAN